MIRANASMGSIAAKIEASRLGPEGSQKRKRSISPFASSQEGTSAADRSGTGDYTERRHPRPWTGSAEPQMAASRSSSLPDPPGLTSSSESLGFASLALASDDQSLPIIDVAQVRRFPV